MTIRLATPDERDRWQQLVAATPDGGNVLQLEQFAEAKALSGWQPQYVIWREQLAVLVLSRSIPLLGKLWYIPKGPGLGSLDQLLEFLPDLREFAQQRGVFLLKIEPEIRRSASESTPNQLTALGLEKAPDIQAASTVLVDLSPDEEQLFSGFPQPGRYAINRARRDEGIVEAVPTNAETIDIAYRMLANTAQVGAFRIRPRDYYERFWGGFSQTGVGQMFFAKHRDQVIAIAYVMVLGEKASYKDGASIKERPVYGASHLLQWEAMRWAKGQGATSYDLTGAPPSDQLSNRQHPLYGLVKFKTSFNKEVTDYIGLRPRAEAHRETALGCDWVPDCAPSAQPQTQ